MRHLPNYSINFNYEPFATRPIDDARGDGAPAAYSSYPKSLNQFPHRARTTSFASSLRRACAFILKSLSDPAYDSIAGRMLAKFALHPNASYSARSVPRGSLFS